MSPPLDFKALVTGGLAFTAAIAWNNAIESSIRNLYPYDKKQSAHATMVYAIIVTLLIVIVVVIINHASRIVEHFHKPTDKNSAFSPHISNASHLPNVVSNKSLANVTWPAHWL